MERLETASKGVDADKVKAEQIFDSQRHSLVDRGARIRDYMSRVMAARAGETVEDGALGLKFQPAYEAADLPERIRILDDLRANRPARWPPDASAAALRDLEQEFRIEISSEPSSGASSFLRFGYWLVMMATGLIFPLMLFAYRLMRSPQSDSYYSIEWQDRAGDPRAQQYNRLDAAMEEKPSNG